MAVDLFKTRAVTLTRRAHELARDGATLPLALGYGCYRGANSLVYSTTMATENAPVLFIANFDFSLASGAFVILAALMAVWRTLRRSDGMRMPVAAPTLALAALPALSYTGVLDRFPDPWELVLTSAAYGVGTTALSLAWVAELVRHGIVRCTAAYALGSFVLSFISLAAKGLPPLAVPVCSGALLAVGTGILLHMRGRTAELQACGPRRDLSVSDWRRAFARMANPIIAMVVLEAAISFLNGFFVGHSLFSEGGALFAAGSVLGAGYALVASVSSSATPDIRRSYRAVFPLLTATVALLPFAGSGQNAVLGGAIGFCYNALNVWTMCLVLAYVAQARLDAVAVVGCTTVLGRLSQLVFIPLGNTLGIVAGGGQAQVYSAVVLFVVYALAMLLVYFTRSVHRDRANIPAGSTPSEADTISDEPTDLKAQEGTQDVAAEADADYFAGRADELAGKFHLTRREREIALLLARGRSATFIAENLSCSPATVRSHAKNIYTKLGVHSKQELIDLFSDSSAQASTYAPDGRLRGVRPRDRGSP